MPAGIETVERALTGLLRHLALDRAEWDRLCARIDDADYVLGVSAESLRLFPPVQGTIRRATETAEFHGTTVRPDDKLIVMIASANRDGQRFEGAAEFRAERFADNPDRQFTNAGDVLPFGAGRHHCAGSRLAGTEMVHSLQQLVRRTAWIEPRGPLPGGEGLLLRSPPSLHVVLHASGP
jgi:cytochrome P450